VNGGSSSSPWHVEATRNLTIRASTGIRLPRHDHAATVAYAQSATKLGSF
jgi:hypothetical protein